MARATVHVFVCVEVNLRGRLGVSNCSLASASPKLPERDWRPFPAGQRLLCPYLRTMCPYPRTMFLLCKQLWSPHACVSFDRPSRGLACANIGTCATSSLPPGGQPLHLRLARSRLPGQLLRSPPSVTSLGITIAVQRGSTHRALLAYSPL